MKAAIPVIGHPGSRAVLLVAQDCDTLHAMRSPDGLVMTEWEFSAEDLARILNGGRIRMWTRTFGQRFQPVALEVVDD